MAAQSVGRLDAGKVADVRSVGLEAALAPVREALMPDAPWSTVALAMQAWATLIGVISLELFGHWRSTVLDPELFFEETIENEARLIGLRP